MGNCFSNRGEEEGRAAQRPAQIDRRIEWHDKKIEKECKILLLGSSGSGKSTIVKQMRIIHQDGFSHEAKLAYREVIYSNLLESIQAVATAMHKFGAKPADPLNAPTLERVLEYNIDAELQSRTHPSPYVFPKDLAEAIHRLWQDQAVSEFFDNFGSHFYLMDNAVYFFTEARRIGTADYVPTVADILRCRQRSTGVTETQFSVSRLLIRLFDVGGQRPERKKWIHCFESVTSIIFCIALNEYDQVLVEAKNQNRMAESLVLFDSVINSRWFLRTSFVLFLNKIDIFRDKIRRVPLELYFQEYMGGPDVNKATKYILWRFMRANRARLSVYPHVIQATDTSNIRPVFAAVTNTVVTKSLEDMRIL